MRVIQGDLLKLAKQGRFTVILHGCNCQQRMGAGIALQIAKQFPMAEFADMTAEPALGEISYTKALDYPHLTIVNCYTQRYPGKYFNASALRSCLRKVASLFPSEKIGYPRIGAGYGGGDWDKIAPIFDEMLEGLDHTLVDYRA